MSPLYLKSDCGYAFPPALQYTTPITFHPRLSFLEFILFLNRIVDVRDWKEGLGDSVAINHTRRFRNRDSRQEIHDIGLISRTGSTKRHDLVSEGSADLFNDCLCILALLIIHRIIHVLLLPQKNLIPVAAPEHFALLHRLDVEGRVAINHRELAFIFLVCLHKLHVAFAHLDLLALLCPWLSHLAQNSINRPTDQRSISLDHNLLIQSTAPVIHKSVFPRLLSDDVIAQFFELVDGVLHGKVVLVLLVNDLRQHIHRIGQVEHLFFN